MIIGKINDKVLLDDLVFREKEPKEIKWLSGGRQQGKTYQLIKDQQKEITRLNNIIDEIEKYHIKSMENLKNTEDFKYVGVNHIKILYEEHKRALERIKELKEGKNNE